ncbi:hypothetical protein HNP48_006156 [Acidovorax soli]|uniref:Uncharacterized protein n=1 Tax=Acidovorax soli TaxID=592050 RepID=A0A7X0PL77_9BURK|nr:hypothetical protein [Acidovorax soli]MBB6563436.1 hypothetical protein [Acidovorax soli]
MTENRISVDFNEMLAPDLVLLSKTDFREDSSGKTVHLSEGLLVYIYEADIDDDGLPDNLIAQGLVERRPDGVNWGRVAKWCCRIDGGGVKHESDVRAAGRS